MPDGRGMAIEIDVEKRRGDRVIAARFAAGPGLTALFGPSGAGKTSILAMVAGLLRPDRGHIRIGDRTLFGGGIDLPPEARRIGYVFQDGRLFPHRRVRANLLYGHRSEEHTSELQSLMRISYAVFFL